MKIVINKCFGGFGLSDKAFELYLKKKNIKWVEKNDYGCYYTIPIKEYNRISEKCYEKDGDYRNINNKGYILIDDDVPRDDKILVKVVEELKSEANGRFAELKIVKIPDDTEYEIEEYDGLEHIAESHKTWD